MVRPLLMIVLFVVGSVLALAQSPDKIEEMLLHNVEGLSGGARMGDELIGFNATSLLVSTDDGRTWRSRPYPDSLHYVYVAFDGDSVVYGLFKRVWEERTGIQLYRSTDHGRTFELIGNAHEYGNVAGLTINGDRMTSTMMWTVHRESRDRGRTWRTIKMPKLNQGDIFGTILYGPDTVIVCTNNGRLYRTTTDGSNWEYFNHNLPSHPVWFNRWDDSTIVIGLANWTYYSSTDLGSTWKPLVFDFKDTLEKVTIRYPFRSGSFTMLEVIVGSEIRQYYSFDDEPYRRFEIPLCTEHSPSFKKVLIEDRLYYTSSSAMQRFRRIADTLAFDGFITMQGMSSVNTAGAWDCSIFGAVDYGATAYVTWSGAQAWCSSFLNCGANYTDIHWTNDTTMWIAGMLDYGDCSVGCLQKYDPTYTHFRQVQRDTDFYPLKVMEWADENHGWLLSDRGVAYMTSNAGSSWTEVNVARSASVYVVPDLVVEADHTLWLAGMTSDSESRICVSRNGGKSWNADILFTGFIVTNLTITGGGGIIAAGYESPGERSKLYYRDPASKQWIERASFPSRTEITSVAYNPKIDSLCLLVNRTLYIGNSQATSLRPVDLPSANTYLGVHSDACSGFLINVEGGAIERYSPATSILVSVEDEVSVPSVLPVTIRRFDLLGREVDASATGHILEVIVNSDGKASTRLVHSAN